MFGFIDALQQLTISCQNVSQGEREAATGCFLKIGIRNINYEVVQEFFYGSF
jgi:hypothetical protein